MSEKKKIFDYPLEVHYSLQTYVTNQQDLKESHTIERNDLPDFIKTLTDKPGCSIEWILITKSCKGCG